MWVEAGLRKRLKLYATAHDRSLEDVLGEARWGEARNSWPRAPHPCSARAPTEGGIQSCPLRAVR